MQQLVAISRAMVTDSTVLILDEPTSSLDATEVEQLFVVIRRLRDRGVAILFVSHFLDQVYEISDRITVLRNGRYVGEYLTAELDRADLIAKMIGKELVAAPLDRRRAPEQRAPIAPTSRCSRPRGLGRKGAIAPTDFELHRGEVVGVAGLLGSGSHRARPPALRRRQGRLRFTSSSTATGSRCRRRRPGWRTASPTRARTAATRASSPT